jgi:hypothetical protein
VVPVLPARAYGKYAPDGAPVPEDATLSRHLVTTEATPAGMARWPDVLGLQSTLPSGSTTFRIACGGWWMPPEAKVA